MHRNYMRLSFRHTNTILSLHSLLSPIQGLKPTDPKQFADMQTKELQNGRLAMIGAAGMCSQEIFNHRGIIETIDFYNKVFSGIDPYASCAEGTIC